MKRNYTYLFFDLDGTLMESGEGIMRCAQHALQHFGIHVNRLEDLLPFVGPPLEDSFKHFYHFTDEQVKEATRIYGQRYAEIGAYEARPYPGVFEFLEQMKTDGKTLVLATSKKITMTRMVLNHFGLLPYFHFIGARDDEGTRHTKADVIRYAIEQLRIRHTGEIVMIGDRKFDIIGARETGIDSIGVLYGYGDKEELTEAGATYLAANYGELTELLR